jgi:hypothetical protein
MMLPQNAQCPDNHSPDDMPTVAMLTPSATRSTSPALTVRLFNTEHDDHETAKPLEHPTLKYIAIIETSTEKAIFDIDPAHVDQGTHKLLLDGQKWCDRVVEKGYGRELRMQNTLDVVIRIMTEK